MVKEEGKNDRKDTGKKEEWGKEWKRERKVKKGKGVERK